MEPKFQTSFIPKKPLNQADSYASSEKKQSTSLLFLAGIFIFIVSIIVAAGAYGWGVYLENRQFQLKNNLSALEKGFDIDSISQLKQIDTKISLAKRILSNHIAVSQVFSIISKLTAQNIRFLSLDLSAPIDKSKGITMQMSGYAPSYEALAFQSDEFGRLEELNLRNIVINPAVLSPMQNQNGNVTFSFSANLQPSALSYVNTLGMQSSGSTKSNSTSTPQ